MRKTTPISKLLDRSDIDKEQGLELLLQELDIWDIVSRLLDENPNVYQFGTMAGLVEYKLKQKNTLNSLIETIRNLKLSPNKIEEWITALEYDIQERTNQKSANLISSKLGDMPTELTSDDILKIISIWHLPEKPLKDTFANTLGEKIVPDKDHGKVIYLSGKIINSTLDVNISGQNLDELLLGEDSAIELQQLPNSIDYSFISGDREIKLDNKPFGKGLEHKLEYLKMDG
jgi:hypothetical protein